jgi:hypothetical protein
MRVLATFFALILASGCFVADEIDSGLATLPSRPKPAQEEPEEAPATPTRSGPEEPGFFSVLVGMIEEELEPEPPPPDPDDRPVRCWLKGKQLFSSRRDCLSRGGKAVELPE